MVTSPLPTMSSGHRWRIAVSPGIQSRAVGAHIGANVIWAGSAVASKPLLESLPPITMAAIRVAIALVVLRLVLTPARERPATGPAPALLGLVGVACFCAFQNLGLLFADATLTALLSGCIPVLTLGLAVPLLHERLRVSRLLGIVISTAGVGIIVVAGSAHSPATALLIGVLPLASAVASALYMVMGRRVFIAGSPLAVVAGSTRYGLMFLAPCVVVELIIIDIGDVGAKDMMLLAYLGAGCSGLAFVLRGFGLKHLGASHGAVYGNLRPVIGVVLAITVLGEPLTIAHVAGGALVLTGIGIAGRQSPHRALRRPAPRPIRQRSSRAARICAAIIGLRDARRPARTYRYLAGKR